MSNKVSLRKHLGNEKKKKLTHERCGEEKVKNNYFLNPKLSA